MKVKFGRMMLTLPKFVFPRVVGMEAKRFKKSFAFMTPEHHRVRNLAVSEMTFQPRLISPMYLAEKTSIPEAQVVSLLDELEGNKSILYRDALGNVLYAYPSTLEKTAQAVVFETNKRVYAA